MDMKEKIEELWAKITADDGVLEQFKDDPIKTVESLLGMLHADGRPPGRHVLPLRG